jgi:hypothetical protein
VVIKKSSAEKKCVPFRDAILPEYEVGSRGIELREFSELAIGE